jgi:hypothetical protein
MDKFIIKLKLKGVSIETPFLVFNDFLCCG